MVLTREFNVNTKKFVFASHGSETIDVTLPSDDKAVIEFFSNRLINDIKNNRHVFKAYQNFDKMNDKLSATYNDHYHFMYAGEDLFIIDYDHLCYNVQLNFDDNTVHVYTVDFTSGTIDMDDNYDCHDMDTDNKEDNDEDAIDKLGFVDKIKYMYNADSQRVVNSEYFEIFNALIAAIDKQIDNKGFYYLLKTDNDFTRRCPANNLSSRIFNDNDVLLGISFEIVDELLSRPIMKDVFNDTKVFKLFRQHIISNTDFINASLMNDAHGKTYLELYF